MNNQKTFASFDIAVLLACYNENDAQLTKLNESNFEGFKQAKINLIGYIDAKYRVTDKGKLLVETGNA